MPDDPHYFIGFPVPDEQMEILQSWQEDLEPFVDYRKWVHHKDFHITLRFFGALTATRLQELVRELKSIQSDPLTVHIQGLNFFGKEDQPRVMYAEVESSESIKRVKSQVEQVVSQLNFDSEKRPYRPHITLAKKWRKGKLYLSKQALENKIESIIHFSFHINQFNLYKVHPDRKQKYEIIETFTFE